jgi:putative ABC transport system substrate-binding protein
MIRREFITLLGGAAVAWPLAAHAQQAEQMRKVGVLISGAADDPEYIERVRVLREAMAGFGWSEGKNMELFVRFGAGSAEQMRIDAAELVALRPDVIVGISTPVTNALAQATKSLPIIFLNVSDPVGSGFVQSFARPGGNLTGFSFFEPGMSGKCMELLKEIYPRLAEVSVPFNPRTAINSGYFLRSVQEAATALGITALATEIRDIAELNRAIEAAGTRANGGLLIVPDPFTVAHRKLIVSLAERLHIPAAYPFRVFVKDGGLLSYGADSLDQCRRAASYVDRVLRGAKVTDLPVQAPTKFELVINLKTAKALGLDVPLHMQQLADEVLE